jgi:hypothetical protein
MRAEAIESLAADAAVVHVGGASFVMPWREFRATPSQVARIQVAAMLGAAKDQAVAARRLLADVEAEMATEARRRAKTPPEGRAVHVPRHLYAEDGPIALVPARDLGLPCYDDAGRGGRVYAPDPVHPRSLDGPEADHDPLADERAKLHGAAIEPGQAWRLATAELYTDKAAALREARPKGARISDEEKGASSTARRILIRLRREILEKGEAGAVRRRILNAEHLADQEGRAARRRAMQIRRAELIAAGVNQWERVRQLWAYRRALRLIRTSRNVDGLTLVVLTPIRRSCAEWYRSLYERTERGARVANMEGRVGGEPQDREVKDWGADQIARKQVEARVMAACKGGIGLEALRAVAGQGRSIRSLAPTSGARQARLKGALLRALDVVADYRGLT